jgi:hypothetical protein
MTKARQWLLGTIATAALAGVFMLYAQPDFMVQMVNQVWGCF